MKKLSTTNLTIEEEDNFVLIYENENKGNGMAFLEEEIIELKGLINQYLGYERD